MSARSSSRDLSREQWYAIHVMPPFAARMLGAGIGVALVTVLACDDTREADCTADTDCSPDYVCRSGRCARSSPETNANAPDGAAAVCAAEGAPCASPDECCARACTAGRCGTPASAPTPTCRGVYELCQDDCCSGLRCISGTCR